VNLIYDPKQEDIILLQILPSWVLQYGAVPSPSSSSALDGRIGKKGGVKVKKMARHQVGFQKRKKKKGTRINDDRVGAENRLQRMDPGVKNDWALRNVNH